MLPGSKSCARTAATSSREDGTLTDSGDLKNRWHGEQSGALRLAYTSPQLIHCAFAFAAFFSGSERPTRDLHIAHGSSWSASRGKSLEQPEHTTILREARIEWCRLQVYKTYFPYGKVGLLLCPAATKSMQNIVPHPKHGETPVSLAGRCQAPQYQCADLHFLASAQQQPSRQAAVFYHSTFRSNQ